jgi:hypothetical protein
MLNCGAQQLDLAFPAGVVEVLHAVLARVRNPSARPPNPSCRLTPTWRDSTRLTSGIAGLELNALCTISKAIAAAALAAFVAACSTSTPGVYITCSSVGSTGTANGPAGGSGGFGGSGSTTFCKSFLPQELYQTAQFWYNMIRWTQLTANCFTIVDDSRPVTIW